MTTPQPTPARSFARDILVNVLANLIAAAVIYLGAVAGGYITASLVVMIMASLLLMAAVANVALLKMQDRLSERAAKINDRAGIVLGYIGVGITLIFTVMALFGIKAPEALR